MPVITLKENTARNVVYSWGCPRCGYEHYPAPCPFDSITDSVDDDGNSYIVYETCPCCGQLIRRTYA